MFRLEGGRPGDRRGFLHKKLLRIGERVAFGLRGRKGVLQVGSQLPGFAGQAARFGQQITAARPVAPRTTTARPSLAGAQGKELGRDLKFGSGTSFAGTRSEGFLTRIGRRRGFAPPADLAAGPCDFPKVIDAAGRCRTPTSGEFGGPQFEVGEAVMGRYGAALEPGSKIIDRAICLRGMQLGDDGLCYNKSQITNKQRMWPAGRRPLLSGGDMRAIGIAARVGRRLDGATKRLQRLGMMKKPASRRTLPAHGHAKQIAAVSVPS